jgi:glyoxylase-like metal-dependent hydrolase (beta-lactamase superfamily II)
LAYTSAKASEIAKVPYPSKTALKYPLDYPIEIVADGDRIDLGGRTLEVIEIPAHAPSSVAFLDSKQRILFTGDEVAPVVMLHWQQPEPQPTVQRHSLSMEKLLRRRREFDFVCSGHGQGLEGAALIETLWENDCRIMSGIERGPMTESGERGEDGPEPDDFVMYQPEYKRVAVYKGVAVGCDIRYVFDRP